MQCSTLDEVRSHIDLLDREIVRLICKRESFVKQAARFKKDTAGVKAPNRVEQVIEKVRALAAEEGGNADVAARVYREMIAAFIDLELQTFHQPE